MSEKHTRAEKRWINVWSCNIFLVSKVLEVKGLGLNCFVYSLQKQTNHEHRFVWNVHNICLYALHACNTKMLFWVGALQTNSSSMWNVFCCIKYILKWFCLLSHALHFGLMRTGTEGCVVSTDPSAECHRSQDHLHKSPQIYRIPVFAFLFLFPAVVNPVTWLVRTGSFLLNAYAMPCAVKSLCFSFPPNFHQSQIFSKAVQEKITLN